MANMSDFSRIQSPEYEVDQQLGLDQHIERNLWPTYQSRRISPQRWLAKTTPCLGAEPRQHDGQERKKDRSQESMGLLSCVHYEELSRSSDGTEYL
jgi:hypothetical protein